MNAKSKASLVGGRIASVAVARPGSVGAPHPYAPDKAHHDTGLYHPRLGRVRGSDEHIVPGGYGQIPGGHRGGVREGCAGAMSLLEGKDFGKCCIRSYIEALRKACRQEFHTSPFLGDLN
jgi:hypothetical protein